MNDNYYDFYFNTDTVLNLKNEDSNYNPEFIYLDVEMSNGLCNKFIYISGLIRFCLLNKNMRLLEPLFLSGHNSSEWNSAKCIKFSEIWDINKFNKYIEHLNFYLVPREKFDEYNKTHEKKLICHKYDKNIGYNIEIEYHTKCINLQMIGLSDNIILHTLKSLILIDKYREEVKNIINNNNNYNCIHLRIESDWKTYGWGYLNEETIIGHFKNSCLYDIQKPLFFSTGENHNKIINLFNDININSFTYCNDLLYDIRAAISFTLCIFSKNFISTTPFTKAGHSTFSCLLRLQRILVCNNLNNYYYDNSGIFKSNTPGVLTHNNDKLLNFETVDKLPINSDWIYYLNKYPDLRANGITTEVQALNHWNTHGKLEGRTFYPT